MIEWGKEQQKSEDLKKNIFEKDQLIQQLRKDQNENKIKEDNNFLKRKD